MNFLSHKPTKRAYKQHRDKLRHRQSRIAKDWKDDDRVVFMEALAIYPPLDKDRLKYYHIPSGRIQINPQSFGRCELIQSFILNKSGHMYTAKEIRGCIQHIERNDIPKMLNDIALPPPAYGGSNLVSARVEFVLQSPIPTAPDACQSVLTNRVDTCFLTSHFLGASALSPLAISEGSDSPGAEGVSAADMSLLQKPSSASGTSVNSPILTSSAKVAPSMSRRRLALHIPVLQRHLSISNHHNLRASSSPKSPAFAFPLALDQCSTPMTPIDQVMHTPQCAPIISQREKRQVPPSSPDLDCETQWSPDVASPFQVSGILQPLSYNCETPSHASLTSNTPCYITQMQDLAHKMTLAESPEVQQTRRLPFPRRLSYSQTSYMTSSPLAFRTVSSPSERFTARPPRFEDALLSPVNIRSPLWAPSHPFIHAPLGKEGASPDSFFSSLKSPSPLTE